VPLRTRAIIPHEQRCQSDRLVKQKTCLAERVDGLVDGSVCGIVGLIGELFGDSWVAELSFDKRWKNVEYERERAAE
jgi:hypothetical protein